MSVSRKLKASALLASAVAAAVGADVQADAATGTAAAGHHAALNSIVTWRNNKTNRYMTVHNGGTANGAAVDTTTVDSAAQQHWAMDSAGWYTSGDLMYNAVNENSAKCLAYRSGAPAQHMDQQSCYTGRSWAWAEVSVYKSGALQGWMIDEGGPQLNNGVLACENPSTNSVYDGAAFGVYSFANQYPRCIWH